jgi:hypothetical protein
MNYNVTVRISSKFRLGALPKQLVQIAIMLTAPYAVAGMRIV